MIAADLYHLIPDDDPDYLAHVAACERDGLHPAHAAVQAHYDLAYQRAHPCHRKDVA